MIQNPDLLATYLQNYGNLGPITMTPGREGGDDMWFTADGRIAEPYWGGVFDTQQFAGQTPTQFTLFGQSGIDPDGTPGRGGIKGIYNAQGQLQGDPWYQQPTNIDWTGPAMVALAAVGGAYGAGGMGGGVSASGAAPINASQIAALGPSATAADIAQFAAQGAMAGNSFSSFDNIGTMTGQAGDMPSLDLSSYAEPSNISPSSNGFGGPDFVGSDWAAGAPTGPTGGSLPTTAMGTTAANTAAASGVAGAVNSGASSGFGLGDVAKIGSAAAGLASAASAAGAPTSATSQTRPYIDPRVDANVWGGDGGQWGSTGLTGQIAQGAQAPLPSGVQAAGTMANEYLTGGNAGADLSAQRNAINRQLTPNAIQAPQMTAAQAQGAQAQGAQIQAPTGLQGGVVPQAQQMQAASINAPAQNNLDLTGYYQGILGANPGTNPFLTDTLSAAAKQARGDFGNLLGDITSNFQEQIIPQIRGAAIQAGGLGGSRNAMSEAIAARDLNRRALSTAENVQNNIDSNMFGQLASSYNLGADRQASLLNSLSGQQYGVGTNQANLQQGAGQTNATLGTQAGISGAGNQTSIIGAQNNNLWNAATNNAQLGQNNAQFNATLGQNNAQFNATAQNNAGANNLQAQLGTNTLNSANLQNGIGNMGNFINNQVNASAAPWNASWQRLTQGAQAAQPYYSMFNGSNVTTPVSAPNPVATGIGTAAGMYSLLNRFA